MFHIIPCAKDVFVSVAGYIKTIKTMLKRAKDKANKVLDQAREAHALQKERKEFCEDDNGATNTKDAANAYAERRR